VSTTDPLKAMVARPAISRNTPGAPNAGREITSPITFTPNVKLTMTAVPHQTPDALERPKREIAKKAFAVERTKRSPERRPHAVKTCEQKHVAVLMMIYIYWMFRMEGQRGGSMR
jgi:hypothetical protein